MADGIGTRGIAIQPPGHDHPVLDAAAQALLAELHQRFEPARQRLLAARRQRQARIDAGALPDFRAETAALREADWQVAPIPPALRDRRVEITGPVDRKMVINALNSGARVYMADFEDSTSPDFAALLAGQVNLSDAVAGTIEHTAPDGRRYALADANLATLMVRPRGWHLPEKHVCVDGAPIAAALFDAGLFVHRNGAGLAARGNGPYLYLPKLEAFEEAALWDQVLAFLESRLGLPEGTVKVTVLIETLPAAFEMDEILHALRGRIVGLNCGRWDYIFSYIKTFRRHPDRVLPERGQVTMAVGFLRACSELLIRTCHRRGALAMGGMAAQIPIAGDPVANAAALEKVRADKLREASAGHDGTWVAHPALIPVAMQVFDAHMPTPNQLHVLRQDVRADRDALIAPCAGTITRAGFQSNLDVAVRYLAAWLDGAGCVPLHHLMEDAATAEIGRAQLWQWLHADGVVLEDGTPVDRALFDEAERGIAQRLGEDTLPGRDRIAEATAMIRELTLADELADFLTLPAYDRLP
ncbi:MAG TPA: malate synthase A [Xanthomonadaceae bacterium]|nr:malate synthase A [Xanthomonadaceae bacterium]